MSGLTALYQRLLAGPPDAAARGEAALFLRGQLAQARTMRCDLPAAPQDLVAWMESSAQAVTARYAAYLAQRQAGTPRQYFANRAHALHFLRAVAPTKLVDGAWLHGLAAHWRNPRLAHLVRTYAEELGNGAASKNHVLLYRQLLARHGLDHGQDLGDAHHLQGLVQLALGCNTQDFLPELIGFNLGYEQLPLHLLVTACELDELGIDPYYFTLHLTVDNTGNGHARRACLAVQDMLPRFGDSDAFWQRVRNGAVLGELGIGTEAAIGGFDIGREVERIFVHKRQAGHGAHSDRCAIGGRTVNDWLARPSDVPAFLAALQQAGWIRLGEPVANSRFWKLLQGERASMFGVFSSYELQLIHDWIRGAASADGRAWDDTAPEGARRPSHAAARRLAERRGELAPASDDAQDVPDPDLQALKDHMRQRDAQGQMDLLTQAMSPALHWTPAGLHATRVFCQRAF